MDRIEASAFFIKQCIAMGFDSHQAFQILWSYRTNEVVMLAGNRYITLDDCYWGLSWLRAGVKFYQAEHPPMMKFNEKRKEIQHKLADYLEGESFEDRY